METRELLSLPLSGLSITLSLSEGRLAETRELLSLPLPSLSLALSLSPVYLLREADPTVHLQINDGGVFLVSNGEDLISRVCRGVITAVSVPRGQTVTAVSFLCSL